MERYKSNNVEFLLDRETGRWTILSSRNFVFNPVDIKTRIYVNGEWFTLFRGIKQVQIRRTKEEIIIEDLHKNFTVFLKIIFPERIPGVFLKMEIINKSSIDIILGSVHIVETERGLTTGKETKIFVDSGGAWWAGVVDITSSSPLKDDWQWQFLPDEDKNIIKEMGVENIKGGLHSSNSGGISAIYNPKTRNTLVVSFLTFNRATGNVTWIYKEGKEILYGWAGCDFAGFQLKPHKKIISETLFLGFYDDPFSGLEDYAKESARHMKAKISDTILLGWNSWYGHYLNITEEDVLTAAKLIRKKFPGYNFSYIQIDHGWQYRNICGYWIETNERFPHGIEWLARKLDRMGFNLGLWIALFLVSEYSPIFKEHPEYLIRDSKGNPYLVSSHWSWPPYGRVYCLDPTHPGAQRFIKETLEYLKKAGVRYYKIDFLWPISLRNAYYYNQKMIKGAEIYREALSMISKTLRGSYIYWCSNPINLSFAFNHSTTVADDIDNTGFRTGSDLKEAVRRFQTMGVGYAERPVRIEDYRRKATTIISRYFLHKNLILINPDVLEVGRPGDYEEAKIRFSVVALCGGQIFLGDNITALNKNDWGLISKCIPPLGKSARPVDLFENTYPASYPHIWHLPIRKKWDRWSVVGIFNLTREAEELTVDFSKLNLKKDRKYIVFEFWEKRVLGIAKDSITLNMPPVTTKLLMIKEYPAHPAVLSTDMHFSQGAVELEDVDFDFQHNILKGVVKRQKGDRGNIFIFVPEGYGIKQGNNIKKHSRNLYTIPVIFTKSKINWSVKFICKKKEAL